MINITHLLDNSVNEFQRIIKSENPAEEFKGIIVDDPSDKNRRIILMYQNIAKIFLNGFADTIFKMTSASSNHSDAIELISEVNQNAKSIVNTLSIVRYCDAFYSKHWSESGKQEMNDTFNKRVKEIMVRPFVILDQEVIWNSTLQNLALAFVVIFNRGTIKSISPKKSFRSFIISLEANEWFILESSEWKSIRTYCSKIKGKIKSKKFVSYEKSLGFTLNPNYRQDVDELIKFLENQVNKQAFK